MQEEQIFNKRIKRFLNKSPNNHVTHFIKSFGKVNSYYIFLDNFCEKLEIRFGTIEMIDEKNNRSLGYIPWIEYLPDNSISENPRTDEFKAMTYRGSIESLAKKVVYKLMTLKNNNKFIEVLNKFQTSTIQY